MVLDVAASDFGRYEKDDKIEEDQGSQDDKENFERLLHRIKSKYNCKNSV